jgi:hypothetical protein
MCSQVLENHALLMVNSFSRSWEEEVRGSAANLADLGKNQGVPICRVRKKTQQQ